MAALWQRHSTFLACFHGASMCLEGATSAAACLTSQHVAWQAPLKSCHPFPVPPFGIFHGSRWIGQDITGRWANIHTSQPFRVPPGAAAVQRRSLGTTPLAEGDQAGGAEASGRPSPNPEAERLWNLPNALSIGRGVSGPAIAYLIVEEQWPAALVAVSVSGATDWLDGYLARRWRLQSVLGSYLDPLGDKVLICRCERGQNTPL